MGITVRRFEDVYRAIKRVPPRGRLFCLFAIDDRPSHQQALKCLERARDWVDHLSATSGIYSFIPVSKWSEIKDPPGFLFMESEMEPEEENFLETFETQECYTNPSLILARKFGVRPRELPGVVIFKALPDAPPAHPLFVPLDIVEFSDPNGFEHTVEELFSCLQEAWDQTDSVDAVVAMLRTRLPQRKNVARVPSVPTETIDHLLREATAAAKVETTPIKKFEYLRMEERTDVKIFVSYAREDQRKAEFLYDRFDEAGFEPWLDVRKIVPGEKWDRAIERALKNADLFVACLSENSVQKRGYLQREFRFALHKWREFLEDDIYIIPIRFDDCQVPSEMSTFQWIDLDMEFGSRQIDFKDEETDVHLAEGRSGWPRIMEAITEAIRRRHGQN